MDNNQTPIPQQPIIPTKPNPQEQIEAPKKKLLVFLSLISVVVLLIIFGIGFYVINKINSQPMSEVAQEIIPAGTSTPTQAFPLQTYTNTSHGYSFQYPGNWILETTSNTNLIKSPDYKTNEKQELQEGAAILISALETNETDIEKAIYPPTIAGTDKPKNFKKTTVDGMSAVEFDGQIDGYAIIATALIKDGSAYGIQLGSPQKQIDQYVPIYKALVSSFKFTSNNQLISPDLKTYTNSKYGLSFEYPANWIYTNNDTDQGFYVSFKHPDKIYDLFSVSVEKSDLSLADYMNQCLLEIIPPGQTCPKVDLTVGAKDVFIDGIPGKQVQEPLAQAQYLPTYIKKDNQIFEFDTFSISYVVTKQEDDNYKKATQKILENIKFTQ